MERNADRYELLEVEIDTKGQIPIDELLELFNGTFYSSVKELGYSCRPLDYKFQCRKKRGRYHLYLKDFDLHYYMSDPGFDFEFLEEELIAATRFLKGADRIEKVTVRLK